MYDCIGCDVRMFSKEGRLKEAMHILDVMNQRGIKANLDTYVSLLQGCINRKDLMEGKRVHDHILKTGLKPNVFIWSALANMYLKCGSIVDARQVFDKMPERNVFTWTIMITGYAHHGLGTEALELFRQMEQEGVKPDKVAFLGILKACTSIAALDQGKQIHAYIIKSGLESDVFVGNTIVDMYAKCGSIDDARKMFNKMPQKNVVSWNAMIAGYAQYGQGEEALELFRRMKEEAVKPNKATFVSILKACAKVAALEQGKLIHIHIMNCGLESDVTVGNILIDMYAKCGSIPNARQVFDKMPRRDVVSWTAMIGGYAQHGPAENALRLFQQMEEKGVKPNVVTFKNILKACTNMENLELGKRIHACIIKSQLESDVFVGSTLIDMYAKCGDMELARGVFDKLVKRDVVSWTAMIAGYSQSGQGVEALDLYKQMKREGIKPNEATFVSTLKACASVAALEQGMQIHADIIESRFELFVSVGSTLVDMYAKCGSIEHARQVFDKMPERNVVSWNAMIAGYSQHGHVQEVLQLVEQMQHEGVELDPITFVSVLSACSHAGMVDKGREYFDSISRDYGIKPTDAHYACMVDLLGRAGHLKEAENFIKRMPAQPSAVVWTTLLGACRIYGNVEIAKHAAECILELEPWNDAAFMLLSNIYAATSMWHNKAKLRKKFEGKGTKSKPGYSLIEVNDLLFVEDTMHPQMKEINEELKTWSIPM